MRAPLFADMKRLAACVLLAALPAMAAEPVDFSRDVLPILSAHCFKCHGRDEAQRKGKLRLDVRADANVRTRFGSCGALRSTASSDTAPRLRGTPSLSFNEP